MIQKQIKPAVQTIERPSIFQLIVFRAGNEEFGVPIDAVREIIKVGLITPIPASPNFISGITNVRGEIITAIDVRLRFSLPFDRKSQPKHIIVTKQEDGLFGLIVDEVIEVLRIHESDIKPPPQLVTQIHKKYVSGVVTNNSRLIILLDLSQVLAQKDLIHKKRNKK
jgi:purine-binding chemotaxis protein CheW